MWVARGGYIHSLLVAGWLPLAAWCASGSTGKIIILLDHQIVCGDEGWSWVRWAACDAVQAPTAPSAKRWGGGCQAPRLTGRRRRPLPPHRPLPSSPALPCSAAPAPLPAAARRAASAAPAPSPRGACRRAERGTWQGRCLERAEARPPPSDATSLRQRGHVTCTGAATAAAR